MKGKRMSAIWTPSGLQPDTCWHCRVGGWFDLSVFEDKDGNWKAAVNCAVLPGGVNNLDGAKQFAEDTAEKMLEKALKDLKE